jgi:hypothetical protein
LLLQRQFINQLKVLHNCSLTEAKGAVSKLSENAVIGDIEAQFSNFLKESKAVVIKASNLCADDVFKKYFAGEAPFGTKENKRFEFPDAFVVQALGEWAESADLNVFVVSADKLFREACGRYPKLVAEDSIEAVLDHVASDDKQLSDFARSETLKRMDEIKRAVKEDFEDRYYWVEDQDGDAEVSVTDLEPTSEPEILKLDQYSAVLSLNMTAAFSAELSYDDAATASYSEGDLVYVEHRDETVEREQELTVEIEVSYEHMDPETFSIDAVTAANPSDGFGIETADAHDWPYK